LKEASPKHLELVQKLKLFNEKHKNPPLASELPLWKGGFFTS